MGFSYNVNVLNQKGSPAIYTDTFANRPPFGFAGRLFIANDTSAIYEDTGTSWVLIANVSSGAGTLQQVTTNGNTSNVGISVTAGGVSTNSLTVTSLTPGSVPFAGTAGLITQDNTNLFWDDTNNRLGINTNTPTNNLDVHGTGTIPLLALNNTAGNQSFIGFVNNSVAKWRIGNSSTNSFDILNVSLSANALKINGGDSSVEITNYINVQSNGSIFGSNANGSDPVRIQGNNAGKVIRFFNAAAGTADLEVSGTSTSSAFRFSTFSTINAFRIENSGSVLVNTPSDDGVNKLQVNGSAKIIGNVAIGTVTSPVVELQVGNAGETSIALQNTNSLTSGTRGNISFFNSSVSTVANIKAVAVTDNVGTELQFFVRPAAGSITQALKISSLGNFIINSNSDDTVNKLQVTGSIKATGSVNIVGGNSFQWDDGSILFSTGSNLSFWTNFIKRIEIFSTGITRIIDLAGTGSRAVLADSNGDLSAPVSDISVKENIEPLKYGLETIMKLTPIQFEFIEGYKNYGEGLQIGAIAQEVEQIIPQAVFETPSTGLKGIDYNQFHGVYIKAIQDLNNIIDGLLKRIQLLENK